MQKETDSDRTDAISTHDLNSVGTPAKEPEIYSVKRRNESREMLKKKRPFECESKEKNRIIETEILKSSKREMSDNFAIYNKSPNVDKKIGKWTKEEDDILSQLVSICGAKNWKKISEKIEGRTPIQCLHRWTKILQPGLVKGPWTIEEDRKLINWVKNEGATRWSQCAEYINGRNGKQCRERWFNTLNPKVKRGQWTHEEDYRIFYLFKIFGGKWSKINELFECRSENSIKNRFYSILRRIAAEKRKEQFIGNSKFDSDLAGSENKSLDQLLKYLAIAIAESTALFCKSEGFNDVDLSQYNNQLFKEFNANTTKRRNHTQSPNIKQSIQKEDLEEKKSILSKLQNVIAQPVEPQLLAIPPLTLTANTFCRPSFPINNFALKEKAPEMDLMSYYKTLDFSDIGKDIANMCDNPSLFYSGINNNMEVNNVLENIFGKSLQMNKSADHFGFNNCSDLFLDSRAARDITPNLYSNDLLAQTLAVEEKPQSFDTLLMQLNNLEEVIRNAKHELLQQVPDTLAFDNSDLKMDFNLNNEETLFNF